MKKYEYTLYFYGYVHKEYHVTKYRHHFNIFIQAWISMFYFRPSTVFET